MIRFKNKDDFYKQVMSHKVVYGLMYWEYYDENSPISEQIVKIETSKLEWRDGCFVYRWGWPGPDWNYYKMEDYGKGWAFTRDELILAYMVN